MLENILNFRKDTLVEYFENQKKGVSFFKKLIISFFRKPIKKYLQSQSEPLAAYVNNDEKSIQHYLRPDSQKQKRKL